MDLNPEGLLNLNSNTDFWTDLDGTVRKTPAVKTPLKFSKVPLHAQLRSFVFRRDGFTCQNCGTKAIETPDIYDGIRTLRSESGLCLVMDHQLSIRNGGSHHPSNLKTFCDSCNARKSVLIDRHDKANEQPMEV